MIRVKPKKMTGNEPELLVYKNIRTAGVLRESGLCICQGAQTFRRLQNSNVRIVSVILTEEWLREFEMKEETPVWIATKSEMESLAETKLNQGVLALCQRPVPPKIETVFQRFPALLLALDRITHAVNLGTIIRNCVAFGCDGLILSPGSIDPYSPRAIQSSSGAIFHLPVFEEAELSALLPSIQGEYQTKVLIADPDGALLPGQVDFSGNICLVFGNEHEGISPGIREIAQASVKIPIDSRVDSLSVASATAVLLYAAKSRRS